MGDILPAYARRMLGQLTLALLMGTLGGWVFSRLGFPLPWLLGAVFLTLLGAFSRLPIDVPAPFRNGMLVVLGVLVGSGFSPEILGRLPRWYVSISVVLLYSITITALGYVFFRRLAGYDQVNAFFAGLPGGLAAVIFIGAEAGADLRRLSLVHSVRIVLVCFTIPLWIRFAEGIDSAPSLPPASGAMGVGDALLLAACGVLGYFLAAKLRFPAPFLLGPLLLSGGAHLVGFTAAKPPGLLVIAAQVVVGSAIGCRFVGVSIKQALGSVGWGLAATALMVGGAFATALGLHWGTGLPFNAMLLSLAPGGLPEMTLIALSLDIDLALVVSHHLVRVLFINLVVPLLARKFLGLPAKSA